MDRMVGMDDRLFWEATSVFAGEEAAKRVLSAFCGELRVGFLLVGHIYADVVFNAGGPGLIYRIIDTDAAGLPGVWNHASIEELAGEMGKIVSMEKVGNQEWRNEHQVGLPCELRNWDNVG